MRLHLWLRHGDDEAEIECKMQSDHYSPDIAADLVNRLHEMMFSGIQFVRTDIGTDDE